MILAIIVSIVAQAGPGDVRVEAPAVVRCGECGVRISAVAATIDRLRTSRRDGDREDAARALRDVRWTCHPEVVHALAASLLRDPDGGVRRESAESLTRLAPCDPEARDALRSAVGDRNPFVRGQAKRGLRVVSDRCDGGSDDRGPVTVVRRPGIAIRVPIIGPARRLVPTTEVVGPGVHVVVNPRPRAIIERGPIISTPAPIPPVEIREPALEPTPRPDELPPPVPTPAPSPAPRQATPIRPPLPPEPMTSVPTERRSSAKPVIPPSDLPPLEAPRRD